MVTKRQAVVLQEAGLNRHMVRPKAKGRIGQPNSMQGKAGQPISRKRTDDAISCGQREFQELDTAALKLPLALSANKHG